MKYNNCDIVFVNPTVKQILSGIALSMKGGKIGIIQEDNFFKKESYYYTASSLTMYNQDIDDLVIVDILASMFPFACMPQQMITLHGKNSLRWLSKIWIKHVRNKQLNPIEISNNKELLQTKVGDSSFLCKEYRLDLLNIKISLFKLAKKWNILVDNGCKHTGNIYFCKKGIPILYDNSRAKIISSSIGFDSINCLKLDVPFTVSNPIRLKVMGLDVCVFRENKSNYLQARKRISPQSYKILCEWLPKVFQEIDFDTLNLLSPIKSPIPRSEQSYILSSEEIREVFRSNGIAVDPPSIDDIVAICDKYYDMFRETFNNRKDFEKLLFSYGEDGLNTMGEWVYEELNYTNERSSLEIFWDKAKERYSQECRI